MPNPILQMLSQTTNNNILGVISQARQIMQNGGEALNMVKAMTNGKNAEQVFYSECQKRGINPDEILKMIK